MKPKNIKKYDNYYIDEDTDWRMISSKCKAKMIKYLCKDIDVKNIMEIGAGDGSILYSLDQQGFASNYYALEISKSGINEIKKKKVSKLKEVKIFDGTKSSYRDNEFDLVILSHVIEHVENPRLLISEANRIGKKLFFEVPCEDNLRLSYDYKPDRTGHINFYNPKTFRRLLQTCDLEVIKDILYNPSLESYLYSKGLKGRISYYLKSFFLLLNEKLASKVFTYHYSVLCKKKHDN